MAVALHLVSSKALTPPVTALRSPKDNAFNPIKLVRFDRHDSMPTGDPTGSPTGGHTLWRIHSGYVRTLTWSPEGDPIPLGFWGAGDLVGEAIAQVSPYEIQCLSAVTAQALDANRGFSRESVMAQVQQSNDLLRIIHCRQMERRLLQFVCWLANRFGEPTDEGLEVPIKLIHQDIADAIGATRVTITRLLKTIERDGKLRWSGQEKVVYKSTLAQFPLDINYQLR